MDAAQFYDLPGAGRLLFADPARLAREAAARAIPATREGGAWALPKAWVEAEAGLEPADAGALRVFWLERLAPPSFAARRTLRRRAFLPAQRLLTAEEAARALFVDRARLERLDADGTLPVLRLDGAPHFDADLVEALVAEESGDPDAVSRAAARRAQVLEWSRCEYTTGTVPAPAPPPARAAPPERPAAYELPPDLAPERPPSPPEPQRPGLSRAPGFETEDED